MGQELTARTFYTGVTRKRILPVVIDPCNDDKIISEDLAGITISRATAQETGERRSPGKLLSHLNNRGLALMRLQLINEKSQFIVKTADRTWKLTPYVPPWWPRKIETSNGD